MSLDTLIKEVFDIVRFSKMEEEELIQYIMEHREVAEPIAKMAIAWVRDIIEKGFRF